MPIGIGICKYDNVNSKEIEDIFTEINLCKLSSKKIAELIALNRALLNMNKTANLNSSYLRGKILFKLDADGDITFSTLDDNIEISVAHEDDFVVSCVTFNVSETYNNYLKVISKHKGNNNNFMSTNDIKQLVPHRNKKSHKGTYGKCFIIGGSKGLTGAAYFASAACIKCGSGLVTLGCPESLNVIFETMMQEVMTIPLEDENGILSDKSTDAIIQKASNVDALLLGCGMNVNESTKIIVSEIIKQVEKPIVIDADGINSLSMNIDVLKKHKGHVIITPHFMEFSRISGRSLSEIEKNPIKHALEFSCEYNIIVVLKSDETVIALPDGKYFLNPLGNPGMATGGSGDVLAGTITSFLGQGLSMEDAAKLGVFVHSLAGDMAALDKGMHGMTPTDILENIPYALKYLGG